MKKIHPFFLFLIVCIFLSCQSSEHQDALNLKGRVKRIVLDNGLKVLLLKRGEAPVFSAIIQFKVGGIEEKEGETGLAHFFEHLAFKGTDKIGTSDFAKESVLIEKIDSLGTQITELKKQQNANPSRIANLSAELDRLQAEESALIQNNEFFDIIRRNGGDDLNAHTSKDFTVYSVSLPSNKLELWAYLESERYKHRVFREFFKERSVVAEERRMDMDNTADGRLYEAYINEAFDKSPYKISTVGLAQDIQNYTPAEAKSFYETYYIPERTVITLVGNFDLQAAEKIIKNNFGDIPAKPDTKLAFAGEHFDPASFPRTVTIDGPEADRFYLGYHRPAHPHPDDEVFDVISSLLCDGRTSRLYKKIVLDLKIASNVECVSTYPAARLDSLFTIFSLPLEGHSNAEVLQVIKEELKRLAEEGPSPQELTKVVNTLEASFIYPLDSNSSLASDLALFESLTGGWEYMYDFQDRVRRITGDDVRRVAGQYFVPQKEVTAFFEKDL